MNELLGQFDLSTWKPLLSALVLPPVPWLPLVLWGAWRLARQRRGGAALVAVAVLGLWLTATNGMGHWLARVAGFQPPALGAQRIQAIAATRAADPAAGAAPPIAVVVLGSGRERWAPEYEAPSLSADSLMRLRYGLWLARAAGGLPVAFTGGLSWAARDGPSEAEIAARIAADEFAHPLRWTETRSRDTRENARRVLPLLQAAGVRHVLLVTHGWHMPRALAVFRDEADGRLEIEAAPLGLAASDDLPVLDWIPSGGGLLRCRALAREWLGLRLGA